MTWRWTVYCTRAVGTCSDGTSATLLLCGVNRVSITQAVRRCDGTRARAMWWREPIPLEEAQREVEHAHSAYCMLKPVVRAIQRRPDPWPLQSSSEPNQR